MLALPFQQLKRNLRRDFTGLRPFRLGLFGDSSTQLLHQAIRGHGYEAGWNIEVWEADYDQADMQILDSGSDFYARNVAACVVIDSTRKLLRKFNASSPAQRAGFTAKVLDRVAHRWQALQRGGVNTLLYANFPEEDDRVFGQFGSKVPGAFIHQLRKANVLLQEFAVEHPGFHIVDLAWLQNQLGRERFFSPALYVTAELTLSVDALPYAAKQIVEILTSASGAVKKCLILDLDNTLWGGIVGDDGWENLQIGGLGIGKAFTELQEWALKLKQRGIILAVCSKNTESVAQEAFRKHPEMVLRLEDFAVFRANWETKVDNIKEIQRILNIGFDSMVFLDDNAFEREMVRGQLPAVAVPDLPEDPADYLGHLYALNLFETASYSEADAARTEQYRVEAQRTAAQAAFANEDEFLAHLQMTSQVRPFDSYTIPRVAQLSQRSNQYNLRTLRYSEEDAKKLASSSDHVTRSFTLSDRFGDHGLIAVVVLHRRTPSQFFIENWFMSCRVLKRGMESFILNDLVAACREHGVSELAGEYIPTPKNELVRDHFRSLGFREEGDCWILDCNPYADRPCHISKSAS
jgi:FkbH-like protein